MDNIIYIFGHKNPDTDTISSAVAYSYLKEQLGQSVKPIKLGEANKETQYAFEYFGLELPETITNIDDGANVILVDHNEFHQSIDGIERMKILEVIDHHRVSNFETAEPLFMRLEAVGCTATIIYKLYKEYNIEIPKSIAGIMASCIISDTLLLKSPTTTEQEIIALEELADIAGIDYQSYGLEFLKAGTDLSDKPIDELLNLDSKPFDIHGMNVIISQINTVDIDESLENEIEIKSNIKDKIITEDLDLFLFVITDILNNNSMIIALGHNIGLVEKGFGLKLENDKIFLKGVVSRKKQIVPALSL